ncbi:transmembrane protein 134 isoform X16 [Eptesicus fuscus]|uniref:transmembrane protein 134 isoform X16 n=1 Tax=Eptesicus fuscus TaxID=29078 RepID=UPI002404714E|nr:transmembrane protein 134 isoform X16 [Eptesicus fuscus]
MTPSSCPWRTRALGPSPAGSPASGRCTSNAGRGSRRPTRTSSPGCATRTWRTMRKEPRCLRSQMGESTPGILAEHPRSAAPSGPSVPSATAPSAPTMPAAGAGQVYLAHLSEVTRQGRVLILVGVGLEVAPSPGVSSAIFFVPGFLLLVPGVYHVIFIYCAVKGHRGFQFFYLPYFEK